VNTARKAALVLATAGIAAGASAGSAFADSGAQGASTNSPGIISGNTAQVPIHIPINLCGNTISIIGLLNPATGNACQAQ
jgi:hypothetical protein